MKCTLCSNEYDYISKIIPFCRDCILKNFNEISPLIKKSHEISRKKFNLPPFPPTEGIKCGLCKRDCKIGEGEYGFCGLRKVENNKLINIGSKKRGFLKYYYDPLPTNCVADWVCSGHRKTGYYNLAIFYETCSLNCLFCQNYHFRYLEPENEKGVTPEEIIDAIHEKVYCICFFGGDPTTQALHSIEIAKKAINKNIVICYESNGLWNEKILEEIVYIVKESGGILKFDIKAWNKEIYYALTGYDGKEVFKNFEKCVNILKDKAKEHLCVSTLMVPGYINEEEVGNIAKFIANFDPDIPYALLAFAPHFEMKDIGTTRKNEAFKMFERAKEAGLKNVRIGNFFLLS